MLRIDAHTHAFAPAQVEHRDELANADPTFGEMYASPAARMATVDDIVQAMQRDGFDAAVVAGFAFARQRDLDALNEHILQGARDHPGVIIPLATLNPALETWETTARHTLDAGARGFGELRPGSQGWDPLGPNAHRLYALARERNAVLLWHTSESIGHAYPGKSGGITPEQLYHVAAAHPGLRMVAAHLGAGLPFFLQMPEVRETLDCVAYDTAASSLLYDDQSAMRLVELAGAEHVLLASDYPLQSPGRQLQRLQATLPPGTVEVVCGAAARTFYLDAENS